MKGNLGKKWCKRIGAVIAAVAVATTSMGTPSSALAKGQTSEVEQTAKHRNTYAGKLGSAKELEGRTVLVSIYANDKTTKWNYKKQKDIERIQYTLDCMGIATDWLTEQAAEWNKDAEFIYDWSLDENDDLVYEGSLKQINSMGNNSSSIYNKTYNFIKKNIPSQKIMDNHEADNIIYMFFYNTPYRNQSTSYTFNYVQGDVCAYEFCNILTGCDGEDEAPAAYAHEILHTFGAPDLYMADQYGDNYGITKKYVKYMKRTKSNDIMYTTYDAETNETHFDSITNELTELDAYYVGLTNYSSVQKQWRFKKSQHV